MATDTPVLRRILSAVVAVYKTAEALPQADPVVQRMKNAALQTSEDFVALFCGIKNGDISLRAKSSLEVLCGYFALCESQKWINPQNFSALTKEYRDLYTQLQLRAVEARLQQDLLQGDIGQNRGTIKDAPKERASVEDDPQQVSLNDRQGKILAYMKKNPESQFGPVAELFDGVSNRTIRRDLDVLVRNKLLIREGNTSSSLYRLV